MRTLLTMLSAGLLAAGVLSAEPVDFNDQLPGDTTATYGDLIRLICPSIQLDKDSKTATAANCVPHRLLDPGDPASTWEGVTFSDLVVLPATTIGPDRLLLSFKAPDTTCSLGVALFALKPSPTLLDVIETTGMPDNTPLLIEALTLTDGAEVFCFTSVHANTSLVGEKDMLVSLRDNHMERVASFFFQQCCEKSDIERRLQFANSGGLLRISVTEDRKPPRTYAAIFRWDPAGRRYRTASRALDPFILR